MAAKVLPLPQRSARRRRARPDFEGMRERDLDRERAELARERAALDADRAELHRRAREAGREAAYLRREVERLRRQATARERGQALKRELAAAGISQTQVAAAALVTKATVCHVLAGRAESRPVLQAIERLLDRATRIRISS